MTNWIKSLWTRFAPSALGQFFKEPRPNLYRQAGCFWMHDESMNCFIHRPQGFQEVIRARWRKAALPQIL